MKNGIKKVYMMVSDYAPGYDAETYFAKEFKAVGGEIVGSERIAAAGDELRRLHGEGAAGEAGCACSCSSRLARPRSPS